LPAFAAELAFNGEPITAAAKRIRQVWLGPREFYILGFAIVAMSFVAVVTCLW
jgi:hypothetical protein